MGDETFKNLHEIGATLFCVVYATLHVLCTVYILCTVPYGTNYHVLIYVLPHRIRSP